MLKSECSLLPITNLIPYAGRADIVSQFSYYAAERTVLWPPEKLPVILILLCIVSAQKALVPYCNFQSCHWITLIITNMFTILVYCCGMYSCR